MLLLLHLLEWYSWRRVPNLANYAKNKHHVLWWGLEGQPRGSRNRFGSQWARRTALQMGDVENYKQSRRSCCSLPRSITSSSSKIKQPHGSWRLGNYNQSWFMVSPYTKASLSIDELTELIMRSRTSTT